MNKSNNKEQTIKDEQTVQNHADVQTVQEEQPVQAEQTAQTDVSAYVDELKAKGVVVLTGRTREELEGMLAAIPSEVQYYCGPVGYYVDKGLFRIQVNLK